MLSRSSNTIHITEAVGSREEHRAVASEHEVGFTTDFVRVLADSSMRSPRQLLSGSSVDITCRCPQERMKMDIRSVSIDLSREATGVSVVIDVLRAFTTAAYASDRGAEDIVLAAKVDEALALKRRFSGSLIMGEVATLATPEFDFGDSRAEIAEQNPAGHRLIHWTSNGTQGVHRSVNAAHLVATGFPTALATAAYIRSLKPDSVTFVIIGLTDDGDSDEDQACARLNRRATGRRAA
jgi:phosphosulfolactate phosphohydrolase-like enzyme